MTRKQTILSLNSLMDNECGHIKWVFDKYQEDHRVPDKFYLLFNTVTCHPKAPDQENHFEEIFNFYENNEERLDNWLKRFTPAIIADQIAQTGFDEDLHTSEFYWYWNLLVLTIQAYAQDRRIDLENVKQIKFQKIK